MPCVGRYSEAWSFAAFWCYASLITGADEGGGADLAFLTDSQGRFMTKGVQPNVGMILYNLTTGASGAVTAVTETTITAAGVTWSDGDLFRIALLTGIEISTIEHYLDIAASDIHIALAATGACDCVWASWATGYLAKLNIIDAASYYSCPCGQPSFTEGQQAGLLAWCNEQLRKLVTGETDICQGETGSEFPYVGWAEQSVTEFNAAQIILNNILRNS